MIWRIFPTCFEIFTLISKILFKLIFFLQNPIRIMFLGITTNEIGRSFLEIIIFMKFSQKFPENFITFFLIQSPIEIVFPGILSNEIR